MQEKNYKPSKRNWVKLWVDEWLLGTTRFELSEKQRSIWIDLIALAGKSRYPGIIASGQYDDGYRGYPLSYLAGSLVYNEEDFMEALGICEHYGKISLERHQHDGVENLVIYIKSWEKYQSEYLRQRKYSDDGSSKHVSRTTESAESVEDNSYDSYDYWFDRLQSSGKNEHIKVLVDSYHRLHKQAKPEKRDSAYGRIGSIYKDSQGDPFFVLKAIWDSKDAKLDGDRIAYLAAMVNKRLGKEKAR